jgi:hypothetical protein
MSLGEFILSKVTSSNIDAAALADHGTTLAHPSKSFAANIIVFREDDGWTAFALEMDVRGYGPAPAGAIDDLIEMLQAQVSFAVQMGHPESVWHRADEKYWRIWETARRNRLVAEASGTAAPADEIADVVPLSFVGPNQDGRTTASTFHWTSSFEH